MASYDVLNACVVLGIVGHVDRRFVVDEELDRRLSVLEVEFADETLKVQLRGLERHDIKTGDLVLQRSLQDLI